MLKINCPAILVSAPASGQGKTLVTAALARYWRNQGLVVQAFKSGPDFIDGMILQVATGLPVYNLDIGMCGAADCEAQLYQAAQTADLIIIEGVMGLYDGTPSSADIAQRFNIPVALVIDASGMAQTFSALAHGLYDYQPTLKRAGVIANKVGSAGHAKLLQDALPEHTPWLGALQKNAEWQIPERHLGLHLAQELDNLEQIIEAAAHTFSHLALPAAVQFNPPSKQNIPQLLADKTIAVAKDAAFCFIYQANIDCLQALGASVIYFSPLTDDHLPEAHGYWLPGGYPELHLTQISQNKSMQKSLQNAVASGKPILAECGGMMALGETLNGAPMFGLLQGNSEIQPKLQGLGTQHVEIAGQTIGAHTFHYGAFHTNITPKYVGKGKYNGGEAVYKQGNITASFLHFYFAAHPILAAQFFLS